MTEEQLACIRRFLEDFDRLAEIAADMHWAKTDTKHLSLRIPRGGFFGFTSPIERRQGRQPFSLLYSIL